MTRLWLLGALAALAAAGPIVAWTYTVQRGDTMASVAARMGVSASALAQANGLGEDDPLVIGSVLKRPDPEGIRRPTAARKPARAKPRAGLPAHTPAVVPPPPRAASPPPRLVWPASGAVTVRYGGEVRGHLARGIDLAAFSGMAVHAAAPGTVLFAGTEPERFGQLIVIDHGHGWTTAYAYLGKVLVREHQSLRAGGVIARIGASGEAKKPTLHFELRHDNVAQDPLPALPVRL